MDTMMPEQLSSFYADDPENLDIDEVFSNSASSDSGELNNLIKDHKDKHDIESTRF